MSQPRSLSLRQSLSAMSYREVKPGRWCKPVGYVLFTYEEDRKEWTSWMLQANNEIGRWSVKEFSELEAEDAAFPNFWLYMLKECEADARVDFYGSSKMELMPEWKYILEEVGNE